MQWNSYYCQLGSKTMLEITMKLFYMFIFIFLHFKIYGLMSFCKQCLKSLVKKCKLYVFFLFFSLHFDLLQRIVHSYYNHLWLGQDKINNYIAGMAFITFTSVNHSRQVFEDHKKHFLIKLSDNQPLSTLRFELLQIE